MWLSALCTARPKRQITTLFVWLNVFLWHQLTCSPAAGRCRRPRAPCAGSRGAPARETSCCSTQSCGGGSKKKMSWEPWEGTGTMTYPQTGQVFSVGHELGRVMLPRSSSMCSRKAFLDFSQLLQMIHFTWIVWLWKSCSWFTCWLPLCLCFMCLLMFLTFSPQTSQAV